jgi:predicted phosphodiesterase
MRVLIVSDVHKGFYEGVQGIPSEARFMLMVEQANYYHSVAPVDFIMLNGDIGDINTKFQNYNRALKLCEAFKMPYFFTHGNHDHLTDDLWNGFFPYQKNYSIKIGDNAFICVNNVENEIPGDTGFTNINDTWLTSVLAKYTSENLFLISHYGKLDNNLLDKCAAKPNFKAAFNGHTHDLIQEVVRGVDCFADGSFSVPANTDWSTHQGWCFRNLEENAGVITTSILYVPYTYSEWTQVRAEINVTAI